MEHDIRFCEFDGRRIAYASVGDGPVLLFGGRWVTHLEEEWEDPAARGFFEELARTHRVVRYDRLGSGLSERSLVSPPSAESEARQLETVLDACTDGRPGLWWNLSVSLKQRRTCWQKCTRRIWRLRHHLSSRIVSSRHYHRHS